MTTYKWLVNTGQLLLTISSYSVSPTHIHISPLCQNKTCVSVKCAGCHGTHLKARPLPLGGVYPLQQRARDEKFPPRERKRARGKPRSVVLMPGRFVLLAPTYTNRRKMCIQKLYSFPPTSITQVNCLIESSKRFHPIENVKLTPYVAAILGVEILLQFLTQ